MNHMIKVMKTHRSHRKFQKDFCLPSDHLEDILAAAKQAPSFENGQFYSMIRLTNKQLKETIVALNQGNDQIKESSEALLFVADLYRTSLLSSKHETPYDVTNNHDALITAVSDASFACENASLAAESFGYGTVIVGGVRRNSLEIIELCHLPKYCFPLFILCIGQATDSPAIKPRLPKEVTCFENTYQPIHYNKLDEYDTTMKHFRDTSIHKPWSSKFVNYFKKNPLAITTTVLKKQQLLK